MHRHAMPSVARERWVAVRRPRIGLEHPGVKWLALAKPMPRYFRRKYLRNTSAAAWRESPPLACGRGSLPGVPALESDVALVAGAGVGSEVGGLGSGDCSAPGFFIAGKPISVLPIPNSSVSRDSL